MKVKCIECDKQMERNFNDLNVWQCPYCDNKIKIEYESGS